MTYVGLDLAPLAFVSLNYAAEKIGNAVWHLASSPQRLQERLADAWVNHLTHVYPARDLTEDLRDRWNMLRTMVTMDPNKESGIGTYRDVISAMSDGAASEVVQEVLMMQHYVEVAIGEHGPFFPHYRIDDAGNDVYDDPPPSDPDDG